jgi:uncharacterized protein YodC (DUF2158 family)
MKSGDLVMLQSGGPTMTLGRPTLEYQEGSSPSVSSELYRCHWFEDNRLFSGDFFIEELSLVKFFSRGEIQEVLQPLLDNPPY